MRVGGALGAFLLLDEAAGLLSAAVDVLQALDAFAAGRVAYAAVAFAVRVGRAGGHAFAVVAARLTDGAVLGRQTLRALPLVAIADLARATVAIGQALDALGVRGIA